MFYMLVRLVLVGLAVWFGLRLWRHWKASQARVTPPREPERFEPTVRCRACGVHLPQSAVSAAGLCGKCSD